MASLNRVCLLGTLLSDPQVGQGADGAPICRFQLSVRTPAVNLRGQTVEENCIIDAVAGQRLAELLPQMFHLGSMIFLEGRLALQRWVDQATGRNRTSLYVNVEVVQKAEPDGTRVPEPPMGIVGDQGASAPMQQGGYSQPMDSGEMPF